MPAPTLSTGYGVTLTAGSEIAEVISITPPSSKITAIQTTNLNTTNHTHTYQAGWEDPGEISFQCNFTTAGWNAINALAVARTESNFVLALPAPTALTITVTGFVTSRQIDSITGDDLIKASFTVKASGLCYPD
jgi:hypothetical protein